MSRPIVLDASALLAYYQEKAGHKKVTQAFHEADESGLRLLITSVNWGEVYYKTLQRYGRERLSLVERVTDHLPVDVVSVDQAIAREAGELKIRFGLSFTDALAAALAKLRKAVLLTADRDFAPLAKEIKIRWL